MSTTALRAPSLLEDIKPSTTAEEGTVVERAAIDASTAGPVLVFFTASIFWLLVGSLLGLLASWKMHDPQFLSDPGWLNFGRIRPAHLNIVAYGWASEAGIGVGIWLMARLCRTRLRHAWVLIIAGLFWNLGILVGSVGILVGHSQSIEWLEFPNYATPLLFVSYALISIWGVIMFRFRRPGHVYVSQWYILAAFFWFPWLYGTATMLIAIAPVQGAVQAGVNWWFAHNALGLWFTPLGLAGAYYMIPKVIGRPVHSYYLSALGFWSLALFYSWNGMHHLIGGPFPAWIITASIVASVMMVIPVVTVAINHHLTTVGSFHLMKQSPTLRFVVVGAMCYTLVSLQGSSMAFRGLNSITHFTHYTIGHSHLGVYGFFSMVMFGCMYYIVPRLVRREWPSARLIRWHFWCAFYGIILMVLLLSIGGVYQGMELNKGTRDFMEITQLTLPWLRGRSLSGILLLIAHLIFAFHFLLMLLLLGRDPGKPTYFTSSSSTRTA